MATNTSYHSSKDGKQVGTVKTNPINDPSKSRYQSTHGFSNDYTFYATERYGDISPFYVANGVPRDVNPLINSHELRTYTLQAPLMSDVMKHKNYFMVPMKAILPNTWNLIYTNPVQGDDVPSDAYTVSDIIGFARGHLISLNTAYARYDNDINPTNIGSWFSHLLNQICYLESIFSAGSLLNYLGFPSHGLFCANNNIHNIDYLVDVGFNNLIDTLPPFTIRINDRLYTLNTNPASASGTATPISKHKLLEMVRENPFHGVDFLSYSSIDDLTSYCTELSSTLIPEFSNVLSQVESNMMFYNNEPIDYSRLIAYQLVCAHFFSNDNVDYIYSAELFRDNALSLLAKIDPNSSSPSFVIAGKFSYNGVSILYDAFSGSCMNFCLETLSSNFGIMPSTNRNYDNAFSYLSLVFGFRKSLKFGDYFTGSRPFPLAVGDVNAPVVSNSVSAIDLTVNISKQRFLNAVNRFGPSVDDYLKGIFGSNLPPVDTDPKWLSNQDFQLFGTEVENTGSEQRDNNSVTTIMKSNGGKYAFEAFTDVPCIFIGVSWYSIKRAYTTAVERFFFHKNRFDMFNPYMQYIGDQQIYPREIAVGNRSSLPFAYTGRYMEYKQRFNRAVGAFATSVLHNWASSTSSEADMDSSKEITISPDFIRSSNSEFDKYYGSLTALSLANYFHFIVKYSNFNDMKRAMDYSPSIL